MVVLYQGENMSKFFYALFGLLIVGNAFAVVAVRDTIYIDYDLQGGKNNPENLSSYLYKYSDCIDEC